MTEAATYDERALAVAQSVVAVINPDDAFLFGSRARGDWRHASDIDIFTIARPQQDTKSKYRKALQAGQDKALELYGFPVKIDLVRYSPEDFNYYRRARTHLAHSALQDGISMSREPMGYGSQYPEQEPTNWPDVEQRFTNYQRQILAAGSILDAGLGYEEVGFHFQRSLENALKGFLAYMEHDDGEKNAWLRDHSISKLQELALQYPAGREAIGNHEFSFLDEYAIDIPYEGIRNPLPDETRVLDDIKDIATKMMRYIADDAGLEFPTYEPPGPR